MRLSDLNARAASIDRLTIQIPYGGSAVSSTVNENIARRLFQDKEAIACILVARNVDGGGKKIYYCSKTVLSFGLLASHVDP